MSTPINPQADIILRAAAALIERLPAYRDMMELHAAMFCAQEEALGTVRLAPAAAPDTLAETLAGRAPLVRPPAMSFDPDATTMLFAELCRLAIERGSGLAASARILAGRPDAAALLAKPFLAGDEEHLRQAAAGWKVEAADLSVLVYHSLRPSLLRAAGDLARFLVGAAWERGDCPVCGSPPALGWLSAEGERFLHCGFCWHRWPLRRLVCPSCGQSEGLSYRCTDQELEYRIDLCDGCRRYLKTVDSRNLPRPAYPPLEQIASLHLDIHAAELGYRPVNA